MLSKIDASEILVDNESSNGIIPSRVANIILTSTATTVKKSIKLILINRSIMSQKWSVRSPSSSNKNYYKEKIIGNPNDFFHHAHYQCYNDFSKYV